MTIEQFLLFSFFIGSTSFSISYTGIFRPVRELVARIHPKFEELIFCPWCLSHWITFLFLLIIGKWMVFSGYPALDFFITAFAAIFVSGIGHYVLLRAYKPVAEYLAQRELAKRKQNKPQSKDENI